MRREIPHDVDVPLEQAKVQTLAVNIVDLAELARLHELAQGPDSRVIEKGVSDHEHRSSRLGQANQLLGLLARAGDRLLHEHMPASEYGVPRNPGMRRHWSCDNNGINRGGSKQLMIVGRRADARILRLDGQQS